MPSRIEQLVRLLPTMEEHIEKLLPVGTFQCQFIAALEHLGGRAFGAEIGRYLEKTTGKKINIGQIYGTAERLLTQRLIAARDVSPAGKGRSVIVYKSTALGRAAIWATLILVQAGQKNISADP